MNRALTSRPVFRNHHEEIEAARRDADRLRAFEGDLTDLLAPPADTVFRQIKEHEAEVPPTIGRFWEFAWGVVGVIALGVVFWALLLIAHGIEGG